MGDVLPTQIPTILELEKAESDTNEKTKHSYSGNYDDLGEKVEQKSASTDSVAELSLESKVDCGEENNVESCSDTIIEDPAESDGAGDESNARDKVSLSRWVELWKWQCWIAGQPFGNEGYEKTISWICYIFFLSIACAISYGFMMNESTYTDVQSKSLAKSPAHFYDIIVCPPPTGCQNCKPPYNQYKLIYDVWWNSEMLEYFNITVGHLNLLSSIVQNEAFGKHYKTPVILKQYFQQAKDYLLKWGTSVESLPPQSVEMNTTLLWQMLIKYPKNLKFTKLENIEYTDRDLPFYPSWINNAYCLIYFNQLGNGTSLTDSQYSYNTFQAPVGARYWVGNLSLQMVNLSTFSYVIGKIQVRFIHKVRMSGFQTKKICQQSISLMYNSNCTTENHEQEYDLLVIYSPFCYLDSTVFSNYHTGTIIYVFKSLVWEIQKHNVYSSLAKLEISMSILGLFLGFSFAQIIVSTSRVFLEKHFLLFGQFKIKAILTFLLTICSVSIFLYDLSDYLVEKNINKILLGNVNAVSKLDVYFQLTSPLAINFSKLIDLNVSLGLLQYIHIASGIGMSVFNKEFPCSTNFEHHNWTSTNCKIVAENPLYYFMNNLSPYDRSNLIHPQSCYTGLSRLNKEYDDLVRKMEIDNQAPAYKLVEKLHIDPCQLIVQCILDGIKRNCCNQFKWLAFAENIHILHLNLSGDKFSNVNKDHPDVQIQLDFKSLTTFRQIIEYMLSMSGNSNKKKQTLIKEYKKKYAYEDSDIAGYVYLTIGPLLFNYYGSIQEAALEPGINIHAQVFKLDRTLTPQTDFCSSNAMCWGGVRYGAAAKQLYTYKKCNCFICNNEMNAIMLNENRCCSPKKAVTCLANPLLYIKESNAENYKNCSFTCPERTATVNASCGKCDYVCNNDSSKNIIFDPPKYISWNIFYQRYMFNLPKSSLIQIDTLKEDLNKYSCNYPESSGESCERGQWNAHKYKPTNNSDKYITEISYRLESFTRESIQQNIVSTRSDRSFSTLEAFGLFLGGIGMFLGLDLISVIEFWIKYFSMKNENIGKRLKKAFVPINVHCMRLFRHFAVPDEEPEGNMDQNNEPSNSEPSFKNSSALFLCVSSACLLVVGVGICIYASTSGLLTITEYNLEIIDDSSTNDFSSFGICTNGKLSRTDNATHATFLNSYKCWLAMIEVPCKQVLQLYIFTGKQHCYFVADYDSYNIRTNPLKSDTEFQFVIAVHNVNTSFEQDIWIGDLKQLQSRAWISEIRKWKIRPVQYNTKILSSSGVIPYQIFHNYTADCFRYSQLLSSCTRCNGSTMYCCAQLGSSLKQIFPSHEMQNEILSCNRAVYKHSYNDKGSKFLDGDMTCNEYIPILKSSIWKKYKNKYHYFALKKSTPYVMAFKELPRHSSYAKLALLSGYIDIFAGYSILSIGGAITLFIIRYIKKAMNRRVSPE